MMNQLRQAVNHSSEVISNIVRKRARQVFGDVLDEVADPVLGHPATRRMGNPVLGDYGPEGLRATYAIRTRSISEPRFGQHGGSSADELFMPTPSARRNLPPQQGALSLPFREVPPGPQFGPIHRPDLLNRNRQPGTGGRWGGLTGLATGVVAGGLGGYYMGDGSAGWFVGGAISGAALGSFARFGVESVVSMAQRGAKRMAESSSDAAVQKAWMARAEAARKVGQYLTTKEGRYAQFAAGSMLAGGTFSAMFSSDNRRNHRRGFNRNRGNSF